MKVMNRRHKTVFSLKTLPFATTLAGSASFINTLGTSDGKISIYPMHELYRKNLNEMTSSDTVSDMNLWLR